MTEIELARLRRHVENCAGAQHDGPELNLDELPPWHLYALAGLHVMNSEERDNLEMAQLVAHYAEEVERAERDKRSRPEWFPFLYRFVNTGCISAGELQRAQLAGRHLNFAEYDAAKAMGLVA